MKKLWFLSVFVIPVVVLTLFTGCPGGDGVTVGKGTGSFTYDSTTYPLTNASIDDYQDGWFELYIASDGIDAYEWTGTGNIMYFELYSPTGGIAAGTYDWNTPGSYYLWWCSMGLNYDTATDSGTVEHDAVSGSISIAISGGTYTITWSVTMDDAKTITGSYTGTVSVWYP